MWEQRKKRKTPGDSNGPGFDNDALENMPDVEDALAEAEALIQEAERAEMRIKEHEKKKKQEQEQERDSGWDRCRC